MRLDVAGRSDVGKVRTHNDDRYAIRHDLPGGGVLCILADGMGGYASGDLAATIAVETVIQGVEAGADLAATVAKANAEIYRRSRAEARHRGMGTTVTCVIIGAGQAQIVHVGDSRMYLIRDGSARQLTTDHSWVAEEVRAGRMTAEAARNSSSRNLITRALGLEDTVPTDSGSCPLSAGDSLLLCSDGVHNLVSEAELVSACEQSAAQGSDDLVEAVRARGAPDNATVVIARILRDGGELTRPAVTRPLPDLTGSVAQPERSSGAVSTEAPQPGPPDDRLPAKERHAARSEIQGTVRHKGFSYRTLALLLLALVVLGGLIYFGLLGLTV